MEDEYNDSVNEVNHKLGLYMREASGWVLDKVENIYLKITSYNPIRGSCHRETPKRLKNKNAIINVKNKDNRCFENAILASVFPANNNKNKVFSNRAHINELKTVGIEMPMSIKDITKFEKQNDYIINVYSGNRDGTNIQPRRISKIRDNKKKTINLLMLENDEKYHYVLITDLNRLLGSARGDTKVF